MIRLYGPAAAAATYGLPESGKCRLGMCAVRAGQTPVFLLIPVDAAANGKTATFDQSLCHRAARTEQEPAECLTGDLHAPRCGFLTQSLEVSKAQGLKLFDLESTRISRSRGGLFRKKEFPRRRRVTKDAELSGSSHEDCQLWAYAHNVR